MLEKFLLAVTITIALKLLLGIGFPSTHSATSNYHLVETPTSLKKLLFSRGLQQHLILPPFD